MLQSARSMGYMKRLTVVGVYHRGHVLLRDVLALALPHESCAGRTTGSPRPTQANHIHEVQRQMRWIAHDTDPVTSKVNG